MLEDTANTALYAAAFQTSGTAILVLNGNRIIDCNAAATSLFRFHSRTELLRNRVGDLSSPTQRTDGRSLTLAKQLMTCTMVHDVHHFEWIFRDGEGNTLPCEVSAWKFEANGQNLLFATVQKVSTLQDGDGVDAQVGNAPRITSNETVEELATREQLNANVAHLRSVISSLPVILYVIDSHGVFTLSEGHGLSALGFAADNFVGKSIYAAHPDMPEFKIRYRAALNGETLTATHEAAERTFETRYAPIRDADQNISGVIITAHDVTASWETKRRLEHMAHHDTLTGLPNRIRLADRVAEAIHRAHRTGQPFAVLFVDIDGFKHINDSLGHATGDRVLKLAAARFTTIMRESDTVARIGGDEFAVLIEGLTCHQDASVAAQKLLDAMAAGLSEQRIPVRSSASVGISLYPSDGDCLESLLANADLAMYEAKRNRGTYRFFSHDMNSEAGRSVPLASGIPETLETEGSVLHYQPATDRGDNTSCYETLTRWNCSAPSLSPSGEFVLLNDSGGYPPRFQHPDHYHNGGPPRSDDRQKSR